MALSEAGEILRRYVMARRRRGSVRSVNLESEGVTGGSGGETGGYANLCALVRGVPEWTLAMLEIWVCDNAGSTWSVDVVVMRGEPRNIPVAQEAVRLTLREAAERLGVRLTHQRARALYREAMSIVTDNLVARAKDDPPRQCLRGVVDSDS